MTSRNPTNPPAEKKVGSTELAETLPKFNYNQYWVDKRGWSENEFVNFKNKSNVEHPAKESGRNGCEALF